MNGELGFRTIAVSNGATTNFFVQKIERVLLTFRRLSKKNNYFSYTKKLTVLTVLVVSSFIVSAQSYLTPSEGFNAIDVLPNYDMFSSFDVYDGLLYANDGDTIRCFNMETGVEINKYGKPSDYACWPSFVSISPGGTEIWAGFTNSGNTDDRIYSINVETGVWVLKALMPGNYDLDFLNDKVLVSGLNSTNWSDPTSIFVLDTEGTNNHTKIIEIGGNSTGLAIDSDGNIYYTSSFFDGTANAVYRWSSADVNAVINNPEATSLTLTDATKLTDIPSGTYDCEVDAGGNLLFNFNDFSSDKVLAVWNKTLGNGYNFDTLAVATDGMDWLTMVKSCGNVLEPTDNTGAYVLSWGRPVAKVMRSKPPVVIEPLGIISAYEDDNNLEIALNNHFGDPDNTETLTYEIVSNSFDNVALASINEAILSIDFIEAGQTSIVVKATSNGQSVTDRLIVGVYPEIIGDYTISNFEDLTLEEESYWNGQDGSGGFISGLAQFENSYSEYGWIGWSYSNTSDIVTPGYTNQYSAITGAGFDTLTSDGKNYGVAFVSTDWGTNETIPLPLTFSDNTAHQVKGFYVTNSTYAALSIEYGDDFTKKFGGESGNDPDYLKLTVWGLKDGIETESIEFYLADYRFNDNTKDYIVKTWQWIELSSLGKVDSLMFNLSSTDVGDYGINTPTYFNIDNVYIVPNAPSGFSFDPLVIDDFVIYPNPSNGAFRIRTNSNENLVISIYNINGILVYKNVSYQNNDLIDISKQAKGNYFVKISTTHISHTKSIIVY